MDYSIVSLPGGKTSLKVFENCGYSFSSIIIDINGKRPTSSDKEFFAYQYGADGTFKLCIEGIKSRRWAKGKEIVIRLRNDDTDELMYKYTYTPSCDDDSVADCIDEVTGSLEPSLYTLSIENAAPTHTDSVMRRTDKGCALKFRIYPNGSEMQHVMPASLVATMADSNMGKRNMDIRMTFADKVGDDDHYDAMLFNSSMSLMADATVAAMSKKRKRTLMAHIDSAYTITEGEYACCIRHNGIPFAKATLNIDANGDTLLTRIEDIGANSCWHIIAMDADTIGDMASLYNVAGCRDIKAHALETYKAFAHNRLRHKVGVADILPSMHHVFCGKGSESETEVIKWFVDAAMPQDSMMEVDLSLFNPADINCYDEIKDAMDKDSEVILVKNAGCLLMPNADSIVAMMLRKMECGNSPTMILHCTHADMAQLEQRHPRLMAMIESQNRISFPRLSATDAMLGIEKWLGDRELSLAADAAKALAEGLRRLEAHNATELGDISFGKQFATKAIMPRFCQRMFNSVNDEDDMGKKFLTTVVATDIDWHSYSMRNDNVAECLGEIADMTGLKEVKETLRTIAMRAAFDARRQSMGQAQSGSSPHHMIFTGNPGTGKTTIAKKLGKLLHAVGILSKGDVVVAERANIVGRYIGQTEENMRQLLRQAQGNILFIDEAYSLVDTITDRKDFGYRAIECLLTALSQPSADMVVILAGYEKDMDLLLSANQGLRGRFPHHLRFADYDADELMEIGTRYISHYGLAMTDSARQLLYDMICEKAERKEPDFGNARWIEQLIDSEIIPAMAERTLTMGADCDENLITRGDMEAAKAKLPKLQNRSKIGF